MFLIAKINKQVLKRFLPKQRPYYMGSYKSFCSFGFNPADSLYSKIVSEKVNYPELCLNLLKYLEQNQLSFKNLYDDSMKIAVDIAEGNANDFLKTELARMNRQISEFYKENMYYDQYRSIMEEIFTTEKLRREALDIGDDELASGALNDINELTVKLKELKEEILDFLIPDDDNTNSISMEIRSAAGGTESALFAEDIVNMYRSYCERMGFEMITTSYCNESNLRKGCKNGTFKLKGDCVIKYFKFESGVHKVQRVPITEKNGRIHSSTCSVAIFAEKNFQFGEINERDLRIDYFRSSGAGGQNVNKTESAVRITHIPSGVVVQNQDEREQHRNRAKAMEVLRQRLYSQQLLAHRTEINDSRKAQHGTGNLSEKIRTYNWPDSRVTDHRIGLTLYGIDRMLNGEHLETIVDKLIENEKKQKLSQLLNSIENI